MTTPRVASTRLNIVLGLVCCLAAAGSGAQAQPAAAAPPPLYRLLPDDVLEVLVLGEPELSILQPRSLDVAPDGTITIAHVGTVHVEGMTVDEVSALIAARLAEGILVDPQVTVRCIRAGNQKITVVGAVRTPGSYAFSAHMTVREALGLAGGLAVPAAEPQAQIEARIVHPDGSVLPVDVAQALGGGGMPADIALIPGDMLLIQLKMNVYLLGYVTRPGLYSASNGLRLTGLLAQAGGVREPEADQGAIRVTRASGAVLDCDLTEIVAGDAAQDVPIVAGDIIYVPRLMRNASILGFVYAPGRYSLKPGDRVLDLLAEAGGALRGDRPGDLTRVAFARPGGSPRTLDLDAALAGDMTGDQNPVLQPGDQVYVPEADNRVIVTGYVQTPGVYTFRLGETVQVALGLAGGITPATRAAAEVHLRHAGGQSAVVDPDTEVQLRPGDQIEVTLTRNRVTVVGFVNNPGVYEYQTGETVVDMIAQANGGVLERPADALHTQRAAPRAFLYRKQQEGYAINDLDLNKFYGTGDAQFNPEVLAGDIIYVPGKRSLDLGQVLRDLLIIPRLF